MSFHVYEYKVSKQLVGKEMRQLKLIKKRTSIGGFHCVYYGPALSCARHHHASYMLAMPCCGERRKITRGCVSSHCDYGERMALSFNKEIQLGYYQNTSVSVEGALLEWVDDDGVKHTQYFGHWSDNSMQDASATTQNMQCELCVDGDATQLVEGLALGGTI